MRRRMRVFAPLGQMGVRVGNKLMGREPAEDKEQQRRREDAERKAIVSLYGRDLSSEDEIADAPEAPRKDNAA